MITTISALLIFVVVAIPGLSAIWVIKRFVPGRLLSTPEFLIWSFFWSLMMYTALVLAHGTSAELVAGILSAMKDDISVRMLRAAAGRVLLIQVLSLVLAFAVGKVITTDVVQRSMAWIGMLGLSTSWDWLLNGRSGWVQVRTKEGVYLGHMFTADESSTNPCGLLLRRNYYPDGGMEPIRFVLKEHETEDGQWPEVPHEWVYIPRGEIEAIWALPVSREEAENGKEK